MTRWFNEWGRRPPFDSYLTDTDLGAIRRHGFTVVRLAVDPKYLYHTADSTSLDATVAAQLDSAIDRLLAHDLAVIVTPFRQGRSLSRDPAAAAAFVRFWGILAAHLAVHDPERVFLEVLNEPVFKGREASWLALQRELVATMRRTAPRHTIIASGPSWSAINGLLQLAPLPDPNVVYTFHYYEPWVFTHQGVRWAGEGQLRGLLPYSVDSARCTAALSRVTDSVPRSEATGYCDSRWDARKMAASLDRAYQWQEHHHAPVFAGELGVYCAAASADRLAWLRDVRVALERRRIGWALWGWDDCFGLNARHGQDGRLVLDSAVVVGALGLRP